MTYNEILRIEGFIDEINLLKNSKFSGAELKLEAEILNDKIKSRITEYNPTINWNIVYVCYNEGSYISTPEVMGILGIMQSALEGILDREEEYPNILDIRKDIDEGHNFYNQYKLLQDKDHAADDYISKMMVKYSSALDDYQKKHFLTPSDIEDVNLFILVLEKYMRNLLRKPSAEFYKNVHDINISNNNSQVANAQASASVDVKIDIENLIETVEESGLNEELIEEVVEQINKLKEISEEKTKKSTKWAKLKEILKWTIEQGALVASWIVPLIAQTMK